MSKTKAVLTIEDDGEAINFSTEYIGEEGDNTPRSWITMSYIEKLLKGEEVADENPTT